MNVNREEVFRTRLGFSGELVESSLDPLIIRILRFFMTLWLRLAHSAQFGCGTVVLIFNG